jgi:hypothetical protein
LNPFKIVKLKSCFILIWGRCNLKRSRRTVIFLPVYKISSLKITVIYSTIKKYPAPFTMFDSFSHLFLSCQYLFTLRKYRVLSLVSNVNDFSFTSLWPTSNNLFTGIYRCCSSIYIYNIFIKYIVFYCEIHFAVFN